MYNNLKDYFENVEDGGEQSNFLEKFGREDVQDGICLNLVLAWFYFYKCANREKAPNVIWREMKNPPIIKQIANNQSAYVCKDFHLSVTNILNCYKLVQVDDVSFLSPYDIAAILNQSLRENCMCLLTLYFNDGGHAIGVIKHSNGKIYVYDPNLGVMSVDPSMLDELFNAIINMYESEWKMRINNGNIIGVQ